jgi:chromosome segregation ATPase
MILGEMYESGTGVSKNLVEAQAEYKRATVKGISGSEGAYYAVTDLLSKQKLQAQADEEKRIAAEKLRKEEADREAQRKKAEQEQEQQKQAQAKKDAERKSLEEERRALEEQKRQLEEQQKELAAQKSKLKTAEPVAKPAAKPAEEVEGFNSDSCKSKAARFRSQCQ